MFIFYGSFFLNAFLSMKEHTISIMELLNMKETSHKRVDEKVLCYRGSGCLLKICEHFFHLQTSKLLKPTKTKNQKQLNPSSHKTS